MIKKLDLLENVEIIPKKDSCHDYCLVKSSVLLKINELIDAVNSILDYAPLEMAKKTESEDPFEEERKWIGKLCYYKLCDNDTWKVGKLAKINENTDVFCPFMFNGLWCKICKPVKPDDDIIYKGE